MRLLTDFMPEVSRGLFAQARGGTTFIHSGSSSHLMYFTTSGPTATVPVDRIPAGFTTDPNNLWQLEAMYNAAAGATNMALIAHAAPNLSAIDNNVARPVYYGDIYNSGTALVTVGQSVSGGCVVLHPFLFLYDSDGNLLWSDANQPTVWAAGLAGSARPTSSKIVKGLPIRGGAGYSPSGLFWSLDSVLRAYFVGGTSVFAFDIISDQSTILSSSGVVEFDGLYYWIGVDRFYVYNGLVRELPNTFNKNYVFDNMTPGQGQRIFAMKIPRWGEICWFVPMFGSSDPNWVIVYNVRENCWYDSPLPNDLRTAGFYAQTLGYPLMGGSLVRSNGLPIWIHEQGTDQVIGGVSTVLRSYFATSLMSRMKLSSPTSKAIHVGAVELDFTQSGQMRMNIEGSVNARSTFITGPDKTFQPTTQAIFPKEERRELRFRFESNTAGGDYYMGRCIAHVKEGTGKVLG
jgi:hypothetical protein